MVPENITKKAARDKALLANVVKARATAKKDRAAARKVACTNAEKYHKEYVAADAAAIKSRRDAKKAGNFFVDAEAKVAFVIRTRG
jgi:large subunit ribosomal protein L7e